MWLLGEQVLHELICVGMGMRVQEGDQSGPQQESIAQLRNAVYDTLKVSLFSSTEGCSSDMTVGTSATSCASVLSCMKVPFTKQSVMSTKGATLHEND